MIKVNKTISVSELLMLYWSARVKSVLWFVGAFVMFSGINYNESMWGSILSNILLVFALIMFWKDDKIADEYKSIIPRVAKRKDETLDRINALQAEMPSEPRKMLDLKNK